MHKVEHPLVALTAPLSQFSKELRMPSPHTFGTREHTLGEAVVQLYKFSIVQVELHPSPLIAFPSSHSSLAYFIPSGHFYCLHKIISSSIYFIHMYSLSADI